MSTTEHTAAHVFELVWGTLTDVLGTAATATMLRRAARSANKKAPDQPGLQGFDVVRDGLDYRVVLPPSWSTQSSDGLHALGHLLRDDLCPLLEELTGPVVIRLLERVPELQRSGILAARGEHHE